MKHNIPTHGSKIIMDDACGFPDKSINITFAEINRKIRSETKWEKIKRKVLYYWKQL
jgi:hypothetical protein